jgi:hypothetical protein
MNVHALHQDIQYKISKVGPETWEWTFVPPQGPERYGRVVGEIKYAIIVAQRAIEVWHRMNAHSKAA